ncbi:MAG: gamma-glutamyl-gamma-aminobutyrate hydrolase family protein [Acidobacteriota bacterium]
MSNGILLNRKKAYCDYEPLQPKIDSMSVMIVDNLLKNESDLSATAAQEPDFNPLQWLREDRHIAGMALENITQNVIKLVKRARTKIVHLSEFNENAIELFNPDAIIISGTLRDFDLYNPAIITSFARTIQHLKTPVLGICGGHQLIGLSFGTQICTLDSCDPRTKRNNRIREYQYRYLKITKPDDPIFQGIYDSTSGFWDTTQQVLRVWQNHGLMIDRVPEGFTNIAKGYLCPIQMMVKRSDQQLIYTVQYHLEKSFEDWNKQPTRWEHFNDSRDGRIIFENFLLEALKHRGKTERLSKIA